LYLEPLTSPFCDGFCCFKKGYHELFAWAGFELRSYWSLPPE
jgi:hypothetical protein